MAASIPPVVELENYISKAQAQIRSCASKDLKVFNQATNVVPPTLRKGHLSRIIVYYGCFNPPHRSHRELVCHAFLRTDHRTIAVMVVPMDRVGGTVQKQACKPTENDLCSYYVSQPRHFTVSISMRRNVLVVERERRTHQWMSVHVL